MKKIMIISAFMLAFFGCSNDSAFEGLSDDSSRQATIEEASMALDDGNYDEVVSYLAEYYNTTTTADLDPQVARLLSSAYMGKAGIDVTTFISYTDTELDDFDTVSLLLSPVVISDSTSVSCEDNGVALIADGDALFIGASCIGDLIDRLERAQEILHFIQEADMISTEDFISLGLISALHYVFILGDTTADAFEDLSFETIAVPVPINKDAYRLYQSTDNEDYEDYDWSEITAVHFHEEDSDGDGLTRYQEDLIDVNDAINAIDQATAGSNDIRDELEEFLREVLMMPTGEITDSTIIETVTSTGIYNYVNGI